EGDGEGPEQRTNSNESKRQHGEHAGREIAIGGDGGEAGRQIPDHAGHDENEPEETEAVQRGDGAVRFEALHRSELRQDVDAEAKQPGDVAEDEMDSEYGF